MDLKIYQDKMGFPEHPCEYCLKRPLCEKRCVDYWLLAFDLKENFAHFLCDSTDRLLFRYLTLDRKLMPTKDLHNLPHERGEIKLWAEL